MPVEIQRPGSIRPVGKRIRRIPVEPINLQFQYTEADFQEFLRNYFWKNRSRLYIGVFAVALVVLAILNRDRLNTPQFWQSTALPVLLLLVLWFWILRNAGQRTYRMNTHMQEPCQCRIDPIQITLTGTSFSSDFEWTSIQQLVKTRHLYLLYTSKQNALILPLRAFSGEQIADFQAIVSRQPHLQAPQTADFT